MLLIAGIALPIKLGDFPIISLVGFLIMFGAGVLVLIGGGRPSKQAASDGGDTSGKSKGPGGGGKSRGSKKSGGFASRMEDRFRRRFEQE